MKRRHLQVRVFEPGNKKSVLKTLRPGPRRTFTEEGIDAQLKQIADNLEKYFPQHEFRLVPLGPDSFNFVWERERCE